MKITMPIFIFLSLFLTSFSYRTGTFVLSSKNRSKICTPANALTSGTQSSIDFGKTYSNCSGFTCSGALAPSNGQCVSLGGNIQNFGTYRAWSDGTYAATCNDYKTATSPYSYTGAIGDGVYKISDSSGINNVYCAMGINASGWTRVFSLSANSPVVYSSYSATGSYYDNVTNKGGSRQVYTRLVGNCGNGAFFNAVPQTNVTVIQSCTISNTSNYSCKVNHPGLDGYVIMDYSANRIDTNNSSGYYKAYILFSTGAIVAYGAQSATCTSGSSYEFFIR